MTPPKTPTMTTSGPDRPFRSRLRKALAALAGLGVFVTGAVAAWVVLDAYDVGRGSAAQAQAQDQDQQGGKDEQRRSPLPQPRPLTADALLEAPIPALCGKPAGRLVDGSLPGIPDNEGFVELVPELVAIGDLDDDGVDEAFGTFNCSAGGVGWPHAHVLWQATPSGPKAIATFYASEVTQARNGTIAVHADAGRLAVESYDTRPDDAACCPSSRVWFDLRLDDGALVVGEVARLDLEPRVEVDGRGDISAGEQLPEDLRTFLAAESRRMYGGAGDLADSPECGADATWLWLDRYHPEGFAGGGVGTCGGAAALWARGDDGWYEVAATQENWPCAALRGAGVPAELVSNSGEPTCWEGTDYAVPYETP